MKFFTILVVLCTHLTPTHSFIGYGIEMYNPSCAYACSSLIEAYPLDCSEDMGDDQGMMMSMGGDESTTPECRANDNNFLTTLAWCMNSTCADFDVETWRLEKYWRLKASAGEGVFPKWSFSEALSMVKEVPSVEVEEDGKLNFTAAVDHKTWEDERITLSHFEKGEDLHARYGIVLLTVGFVTPIALTLLTYLPFTSTLLTKAKPYFIYPSLIGNFHIKPLPFALGNAPTHGQTLYIFFFLALNIILSSVGFTSYQPNAWFPTTYQEMTAYISARTGVLAFALSPLVILLSGRNNILLWVTNWSHATFMVLHRWVARIFAIQVILHSILELACYIDMKELSTNQKESYWVWGVVATLATVLMVVLSPLYFRRWNYELFLIIHAILAIFVLAGSWYHIQFRFQRHWGYELWLYAAFAVWGFDRLLRILRILKVGIRRSTVTEATDGLVRVDIPGVRWSATPGRHAYIYLPTLSLWRPWENHPFSIIPTSLLHPSSTSSAPSTQSEQDMEKQPHLTTVDIQRQVTATAGITLLIKKSKGLTRYLKTHNTLPTLLEGPYHNCSHSVVLKCDRLLLIGGGIGITALLPFVHSHTNIHLSWSLKSEYQNLVTELGEVLNSFDDKSVIVGGRVDYRTLLEQEASFGWKKIGVIVCGPGGLCDGVRAEVVRLGRQGGVLFELDVEAFSW